MKPIKVETSNTTFVAEGCRDLPATRFTYDTGAPGIETVWELSDEEKKEILFSGRIYLYVDGATVQPCLVSSRSILKTE